MDMCVIEFTFTYNIDIYAPKYILYTYIVKHNTYNTYLYNIELYM